MHFLFLLGVVAFVEGLFECPEPGGQFADPESCRHFYSCNDNYAYRSICPEGTLYDGAQHNCIDRRQTVKCGPQPTTEAPITTPDPNAAETCNPAICRLPDCFCTSDGTRPPAGLKPKEVPQMIMITFDGSVNHLNADKYKPIFKANRTNPNGCAIKSTFFMSHQYTDYKLVEEFYSEGHEMAVGSISRRAGLEKEGEESWDEEMLGMVEILDRFANVNQSSVLGMRAPHLTPGGNPQYRSLINTGFVWDSSMSVPPQAFPLWPYTLDYSYTHECKSATCPTSSFPGLWEVPMNSHFENLEYSGGYCPYLDQCVLHFLDEHDVLRWLQQDFDRYYNGNRAPYMLTLSSTWFNTETLTKALHMFIDDTLKKPEVYYVTVTEAVQWMSNPIPLEQMTKDSPFGCTDKALPSAPCSLPTSCKIVLNSEAKGLGEGIGGTRYMVTCNTCPRVFPWLGDPLGEGRKN